MSVQSGKLLTLEERELNGSGTRNGNVMYKEPELNGSGTQVYNYSESD